VETLYTDGDLTLAAYAAALQVVTSYSTIDRQPLDRDLYRKLDKGERTMIRDLVEYAVQVANGLLVPTGFPSDAWRDLGPAERFYVRMLDMEAEGATKVADFQNIAKSFAYGDYTTVMASTAANAASLAGAPWACASRRVDQSLDHRPDQQRLSYSRKLERNSPDSSLSMIKAEPAIALPPSHQKALQRAVMQISPKIIRFMVQPMQRS
jgi:putative DNA methylase